MLASIINRISGVASLLGLLVMAVFLLCLGLGQDAYTQFLRFAAYPHALPVWVLISLATFVHLFGGLRHLIWDLGIGFEKKSANSLALFTLIAPLVATALFWGVMILSGKVAL